LRVSNDGGWLFATPTGGALNPRTDYDDWKKLLVKAGVREAGCTIPGTRPRRCCFCSASPSEL
jgi:hypothetical protein